VLLALVSVAFLGADLGLWQGRPDAAPTVRLATPVGEVAPVVQHEVVAVPAPVVHIHVGVKVGDCYATDSGAVYYCPQLTAAPPATTQDGDR
jgi:hypothetical protein